MKFKDSTGREWRFVMNVFSMARVKRETGIDLAASITEGATVIDELYGNIATLFDVMTVLLREQLEKADVSLEDFGAAINNEDIVARAVDALIEAILDFFPEERSRPLKKAWRTMFGLAKKKNDLAAEKVIEMINSPEFPAMAEKAVESGKFNLEPIPSDGVSDSPAKSE